jgi:hypothetical protein
LIDAGSSDASGPALTTESEKFTLALIYPLSFSAKTHFRRAR